MEIEGKYEVSQKDVFLTHSNEISGISISPSEKLAVRVAIASLEFLQSVAADIGCDWHDLDRARLLEWAQTQQNP